MLMPMNNISGTIGVLYNSLALCFDSADMHINKDFASRDSSLIIVLFEFPLEVVPSKCFQYVLHRDWSCIALSQDKR